MSGLLTAYNLDSRPVIEAQGQFNANHVLADSGLSFPSSSCCARISLSAFQSQSVWVETLDFCPQIMSSVDTSPQQLDEVPAKLSVPDAESKVDGPASDRPMFEHITKTRSGDAQAAVMTKIDLMIIPLVGIIYFVSFLDRANIGNARIAGIQKDLNMTDHQFSVSLTIFYVPYAMVEIPVNLVMRRFGANITIPLMVVLWGFSGACQGAVTSYGGLIACRFFLGMAEGGLFSGLVLYLSNFYPRHSLQLRLLMMFSMTSLVGAFSGLLVAAIEDMDGLRGLEAERGYSCWCVIEEVFTVLCGILGFFLLPREPSKLRWLTRHEKAVYVDMLREDWSGDAEDEKFSWAEVWSVFLDAPHVPILCMHFFIEGDSLIFVFTESVVVDLWLHVNHLFGLATL
ncbi:major facilitator superfamily [Heterobasidion irregulare TC 32-1]|uniref:Major facilitator superfamily n=1 Tax=Heterobasidion irregulare (strain TC 32-1) TaxID=747525 RepID=W4K639_HETIT|nr:major facilitator superfamily [Heterobasidion irregulare TC 32-1]ETW81272.1 major facilitator superfamily [Heterobasidion irregulare TC 32-1]